VQNSAVRIHLIVNTHRSDAIEAARLTVCRLRERGVEVAAEEDAAGYLDVPAASQAKIADADVVICFGGDGTLMRAAHLCSERGTPILGVYFGRFGFVTQCKGEELGAFLSQLLDNALITEERMMLHTQLLRNGKAIAGMHALNEVVLQRAVTARMMTFKVTIDSTEITRYPADGVMVATATGSTAYSMSAGGPIVDPKVQAMILTPITPHTLSARPLVLRAESEIVLELQTEGDAVLSADGQTRLHLLSGDEVRVGRSDRVTRLITVDAGDFLVKLRERLLWGHAGVRELDP